MQSREHNKLVYIACGGTGGHLFPGAAVGEKLAAMGCSVRLMVSPKEVDQVAARASGLESITLPAVALERGRKMEFVAGFLKAYHTCRNIFAKDPPVAVLAMGGFTSAPPVIAGRRANAKTFLHESNTIPGRANRWLSHVVDQAFVGFEETAKTLKTKNCLFTGTPVRSQFKPVDPAGCRRELGLDPAHPVLLVLGGSQGAGAINELMLQALPLLAARAPTLQYIHLTGAKDFEKLQTRYVELHLKASVHSFFDRMGTALGAASAAVSRAGASSLAEIAAMQVPSLLIPYPTAADNHQFHNAHALERTGAARLMEQRSAAPEGLARHVMELAFRREIREPMRLVLARWHTPRAADAIADAMLKTISPAADPKKSKK